ncbi:PilZ domain-containing protein [Sphingomonas sp. KC8]|uniref:PilZ domain-containing protein n=1 Tax=Sphingomonas sp. KC8 TaxID=1030157 RepID=UPI0002488521|nr:PilZ domain-containing protein [Sphingomonas sp. KC8]ARS26722.1 hypothetical protein KC8_05395 [Sphingomonas sp. KC8]
MIDATRRSARHDIQAEAVLHVAGSPPLAVAVCNISRHGIVIDSLASLNGDCAITIEFMPGMRLAARFVWQDGFQTGLELAEPIRATDYWPLLQHLNGYSPAGTISS